MAFDLAKKQAELYKYRYYEPETKITNGVNPETWKLIQADAEMADKIRRSGVNLARDQAVLYGYVEVSE